MNEVALLRSLGQVSPSQPGQVFRDFLRGHLRQKICKVMATEVTEFCGPQAYSVGQCSIPGGDDPRSRSLRR